MAIQFFCAACHQPIEVDDEMAKQAVTCPYCRKVVTAPGASESGVAKAAPSARVPEGSAVEAQPPAVPVQGGNRSGWVGLGCASVSLVILAIYCGGLLSLGKAAVNELGSDASSEAIQKHVMEGMKDRPVLMGLTLVGMTLPPLVGIPCGIVSLVRRRSPRWPGIVSLVVLGPILLCTCFMSVMNVVAWMTQGGAAS